MIKDVSRFYLRIDTGVILVGDAIQKYQCLVLAEIKGFGLDVGLWENEVLEFHDFLYNTCVNEG